jgi:hypothetical protein
VYGCGTALYFHRPLTADLYVAELWFTFFFLPVFPFATWVIRPGRRTTVEEDATTITTYDFDLLSRRPVTLVRFLAMLNRALARITAVFGPWVAGYVYTWRAGVRRPDELLTLWFLGSAGWATLLCWWWGIQRDRIYERADGRQVVTAGEP